MEAWELFYDPPPSEYLGKVGGIITKLDLQNRDVPESEGSDSGPDRGNVVVNGYCRRLNGPKFD